MPRSSSGGGLKFREVVFRPAAVRSSFQETLVSRWWWAVVLRLHGKPKSHGRVSIEESKDRVASGFRFYAVLYGTLGALTIVAAIQAVVMLGADVAYWAMLGSAAGLFLLGAARVAWTGARVYQVRPVDGVPTLMLFLAMVAVYLTFVLAVSSMAAEQLGVANAVINVVALSIVVLFGLGSYAVEMAYLLHVGTAAARGE